jgi:ABC-type glutathione transport system ATPase component
VKPVLEVRDLCVSHAARGRRSRLAAAHGAFWALRDFNLAIAAGEIVALAGGSGSGKTTAARAIARLLESGSGTRVAGSIVFCGIELMGLRGAALARARRGIQMVFQDPAGSLDPRWTAGESISEGLRGLGRAEARAATGELLRSVGLDPALALRFPHELSGGQKQRVAIARALAPKPQLILLDEPTSALDVSVRAQIVNLLADLRARGGPAMLLITHDFAVARVLADRIVVLEDGAIVEEGETEAVLASPAAPATRALVAAVAEPDPAVERARLAAEVV